MRKGTLVALALLTACAASAALAAGPAKTHEATGTLKSIDTGTRTIVVEVGKDAETFTIEPAAVLERSGPTKTIAIADLKTGERVQLHYTMEGTARTVSKLQVLPEHVAYNSETPRYPKKK